MFGSLGGGEILLILVLALLLFGPRKLPGLGRTLGRALAEFRGASNEFRASLEREVRMEELREARSELDGAVRETRREVTSLRRFARGQDLPRAAEGEGADPPTDERARDDS